MSVRRAMLALDDKRRSVRRQGRLLGPHRRNVYYQPAPTPPVDLELMRLLDEEYTRHPSYGSRQLTRWLEEQRHEVNRKRAQRLMRLMGLEGIVPRPSTSWPHPQHNVYPYLLGGVEVTRANQVWAYLVAIIDWYSRTVLA
jgi:putative transposase